LSTRPDEDFLDDIVGRQNASGVGWMACRWTSFWTTTYCKMLSFCKIAVIGEAARNLSPAFRQSRTEIPWPDITSMRNRLVHAYNLISLEIVWSTATGDIPELVRLLRDSDSDEDSSAGSSDG
jgi:uncharacterized protein with HEPN domain